MDGWETHHKTYKIGRNSLILEKSKSYIFTYLYTFPPKFMFVGKVLSRQTG